jgi:hypothetical protein
MNADQNKDLDNSNNPIRENPINPRSSAFYFPVSRQSAQAFAEQQQAGAPAQPVGHRGRRQPGGHRQGQD